MQIRGAICVQNYGSSGSLLMQSLLDSHPNILSLPGLHGHQLYVFWKQYGHLPASELSEAFCRYHDYWFDPSLREDVLGIQQMGVNMDEQIKIDRDAFVGHLGWNGAQSISRKAYMESVYVAYARCIGQELNASTPYWCMFPIHGLGVEYARYVTEDFGKAFFLHTVREPIQNIGSGVKHMSKHAALNRVNLLEANIRQILLEEAVHVNTLDIRGIHTYGLDTEDGRVQSRAVCLEDLHKNSQAAMKAIAVWMDIAWDERLLKSTFDGKLWNNRPETVRQQGIGSGTISKKHTDLFSDFDRFRLKQLCRPIHLQYGYAEEKDFAPDWMRKFILPFLLLLPYRIETKFSLWGRAYPSVHAAVERRLTALLQKFRLAAFKEIMVVPLAAIFTVIRIALAITRARTGLLRSWINSLSDNSNKQYVTPVYRPGDEQASQESLAA